MSLGTDIRTARCLYAILYGEQFVWDEVNVMKWMREAQEVTKQLKLNTFQETLEKLREIPINILQPWQIQ